MPIVAEGAQFAVLLRHCDMALWNLFAASPNAVFAPAFAPGASTVSAIAELFGVHW